MKKEIKEIKLKAQIIADLNFPLIGKESMKGKVVEVDSIFNDESVSFKFKDKPFRLLTTIDKIIFLN